MESSTKHLGKITGSGSTLQTERDALSVQCDICKLCGKYKVKGFTKDH